ncbi:MAG: UDP-N-acetylmuramoyl-L-alanine--D-glutamate ligase [Ruminococcaceae bacterium]|nr:UDP-N-acetylmuramoyl-L-alanine--D-glutamate ligase [Oscillospiraceae bacterium]
MNKKIKDFSDYINGKKVALIGAGVSNMAAVDLLISMGAHLSVRDKQKDEEKAQALLNKGVRVFFGDDYLDGIYEDVLFRSPGIRPDVPELAAASHRGALLTSEMEVFLSICPAKVYAVTGSDGKTTTTTLVSKMLEAEYKKRGKGKVYLGGNIGTPLLPYVTEMTEEDAAVVELSSFQLFTMGAHIDSAVVTNITPNHLNWHVDMDEYIEAKAKIFEKQTDKDRLVLNAENDITLSFASRTKGKVTLFSSKKAITHTRGIYLDGDDIVYFDGKEKTPVMTRSDIKIPGIHNVENYMAACACVWGEVSVETMKELAQTFGGVAHRIELVAEKNGVKYYNSSIDTSPTRTAAALCAFSEKLIVIVGGYDKHIPLEPLAPLLSQHAKFISATGATGEKIMNIMLDAGYPCDKIVYTKDFDGAFAAAVSAAKGGDTVILSPACASFDAFKNFEKRGEYFKELVNAL